MSNDLALYDKIASPMDAAKQLGDWIHKSQLFGTACVEQANVIALECLARGVPPMDLANTYHVIGNKLTMKADVMGGRFQALGGKIKTIERSATRAAVDLTYEGDTTAFSFTAEEAMCEPSTYNYAKKDENEVVEAIADPAKRKKLIDAKKMSIKPKYATPRSLMQMLWARLISDAVRTICPKVNSGTYAPEDFGTSVAEDSDDTIDVEIVKADTAPKYVPKEEPVKQAAESTAATSPSTPAATPASATVDPRDQPCDAKHTERIRELWFALGCTESQIKEQLAKRNVNSARSLTVGQAEILIGNLEKALEKKGAKPQEPPATTSSSTTTTAADPASFVKEGAPKSVEDFATSVRDSARASDEAINRVRALILDIDKANGNKKCLGEIKTFLDGLGKRLADLTVAGVQKLTQALMDKNLVAFFDFALHNQGAWSQADQGGEKTASGK